MLATFPHCDKTVAIATASHHAIIQLPPKEAGVENGSSHMSFNSGEKKKKKILQKPQEQTFA
jgi:hypothetical protein